jgi:hypothetical protein
MLTLNLKKCTKQNIFSLINLRQRDALKALLVKAYLLNTKIKTQKEARLEHTFSYLRKMQKN